MAMAVDVEIVVVGAGTVVVGSWSSSEGDEGAWTFRGCRVIWRVAFWPSCP